METRTPFKSGWLKWPKRLRLRIPFWILVLVLAWQAGRFTHNPVVPWGPPAIAEAPFTDHTRTQVTGKTRVTAAALGPLESCQAFVVPFALNGVQPVWLEMADIVNTGNPFESGLLKWPKRLWLRIAFWILVLAAAWKAGRFTYNLFVPWRPSSVSEVPFLDHARTQVSGKIKLTAAALGPLESYQVFGVPLALKGIQPVWLEIANGEAVPVWYLRAGTDNAWYSPYEAFYLNRFRAPRKANRLMEERFYTLHFRNPVVSGQTNSGFIFTRLDEDTKAVDIDLVGLNTVRSFSFELPVPGFLSDYREEILNTVGKSASIRRIESEEEFRKALEELPRCTTNEKGDKTGDPLNLVVVGSPQDVFPAFSRRGWHGTEQTHRASVLRTIRSAVLRRAYLYSPVSPLYVFGRSQDVSGQKARSDVNLRNHLRLWLTPIQFRGQQVWIGQISRDIGIRFLWDVPPTTHKIDPDTDEARDGLVQDLAYSQALWKFGYVKGVGAAPRSEPWENLTGDPYFTDGLRMAMFFRKRPTTLGDIEMLDWDRPPGLPQSGRLFGRGSSTNSAETAMKP